MLHNRHAASTPARAMAATINDNLDLDPSLMMKTIQQGNPQVNGRRVASGIPERAADRGPYPNPTAFPKRLKPTNATISNRACAIASGMTRRVRVYNQAKTTPITALPMNGPKPWYRW